MARPPRSRPSGAAPAAAAPDEQLSTVQRRLVTALREFERDRGPATTAALVAACRHQLQAAGLRVPEGPVTAAAIDRIAERAGRDRLEGSPPEGRVLGTSTGVVEEPVADVDQLAPADGDPGRGPLDPFILLLEGEVGDEAPSAPSRALPPLLTREARVLKARFVDKDTRAEVARDLGVSPVRVKQIENKALGKLRDRLVRQGLRPADARSGRDLYNVRTL